MREGIRLDGFESVGKQYAPTLQSSRLLNPLTVDKSRLRDFFQKSGRWRVDEPSVTSVYRGNFLRRQIIGIEGTLHDFLEGLGFVRPSHHEKEVAGMI